MTAAAEGYSEVDESCALMSKGIYSQLKESQACPTGRGFLHILMPHPAPAFLSMFQHSEPQ